VGLGEERGKDFFRSLRHLIAYDPDQVQLMYATPHKWTPYFDQVRNRNIVQPDQRKWDYKHQVMDMAHLKPWRVIFYVKLIELIMQARPKAIWRWLAHRDKRLRKAMFWYNNIGKRVWFYEWFQFLFRDKIARVPIPLSGFWRRTPGEPVPEPGAQRSKGRAERLQSVRPTKSLRPGRSQDRVAQ